MIKTTIKEVKDEGGCNACSELKLGMHNEPYYLYRKVTIIALLPSNAGGLEFRLCDKCKKELKDKL